MARTTSAASGPSFLKGAARGSCLAPAHDLVVAVNLLDEHPACRAWPDRVREEQARILRPHLRRSFGGGGIVQRRRQLAVRLDVARHGSDVDVRQYGVRKTFWRIEHLACVAIVVRWWCEGGLQQLWRVRAATHSREMRLRGPAGAKTAHIAWTSARMVRTWVV